MLKLLAVALALLALFAPPAAAWRRPVSGPVTRAYSYSPRAPFKRGWHRGVELAARPGAGVRAACSGRVVTASWNVVTLRCGPWRVAQLPLARFAVRVGATVREGANVGAAARGSLYVSVRRAGDRFGYVDPLRFLPTPSDAPRPAAPIAAEPARRGPPPAPAALPARIAPAGAPAPHAARVRVSARRPLAPWPVWLGLALAVAGGLAGGIGVRARRGRVARQPVASTP